MSESKHIISHHHEPRLTVKTYVVGFGLSVVLTLLAYLAAVRHVFSGWAIVVALLALAVVQFVVQLWYFLHIGQESKPRWKRLLLVMMITFVLIIVLGSIWIMYNLNYRMTQDQIKVYLKSQDAL